MLPLQLNSGFHIPAYHNSFLPDSKPERKNSNDIKLLVTRREQHRINIILLQYRLFKQHILNVEDNLLLKWYILDFFKDIWINNNKKHKWSWKQHTLRRSPREQYSIASKGSSSFETFSSGGTSRATTTLSWCNRFMMSTSICQRCLFLGVISFCTLHRFSAIWSPVS